MSTIPALKQPTLDVTAAPRQIVGRTRGQTHGPITRLMSPSDGFGEALKPFVFLDLFDTQGPAFAGANLHPHSGIITVTHPFEGAVRYEDTTGARGVLPAGGVEWFKAAGGAWHGGDIDEGKRTRGFQLWIALPADHEHDAVESIYQAPQEIAEIGPARILVGQYGSAKSRLAGPAPLTYLAVHLKAGQRWRFEPPQGHSVAWVAVGEGRVATPDVIDAGELVAFDTAEAPIEFQAAADSEFVLGSAAPHPHDLVLGYYSVHTSAEALERGERRIAEIGARLKKEGRV